MDRKTMTRYIPAGMTLRNNEYFEYSKSTVVEPRESKINPKMVTSSPPKIVKKYTFGDQKQVASNMMHKKSERENKRDVSTDADIEASNHNIPRRTMTENTVREQKQITPPKTICRRSKSFKREAVNFNVNEYSVYNVDINSIKISSVNSNGLLEDEKHKVTRARDDNSCTSNSEVKKHFKNRRDDYIQRRAQLQRSKSAVEMKYTTRLRKDVLSTATNDLNGTISDSDVPKNEKVVKPKDRCSVSTEKKHCDCENCDNFINCITWCNNNINFEKSSDESLVRKGLPLLKRSVSEKSINIKMLCKNNILVHGAFIEKPVGSLKDTCFNENVKKAVNKMNCCSAKTLQSYVWLLIQRRLNVIMVSPPQSGKTFSYLPAICTFAIEKSEKYFELSKYEGPLILILCPNSKKCNQLKQLIDFVIEESWEDMTVKILTDPATKTNCDILVTVPTTLEEALKSECVKLKRLCHLVMEDTDLLLKNYHDNVGKLFKILNEIQVNRPHKKYIQVIISTEKWTVDIEHLMKRLYLSPTIIFEDFLQAAIYSNVNFVKKKLNLAHKRFFLEDVLKKRYSIHRSIVFCQEFEIIEVQEYLEVKGIECILISNDLTEDEIFENEDMWCSLKMGRYKVLLCTDTLFEKTARISNANLLVHYSLPPDWNTFQKRFRCLSQHFSCPLENAGCNTEDTHSILIGVTDAASENIFTSFLNILSISCSKHLQLM